MNAHYQRAHLLVEQRRYEMAEQELRLALAQQPNDAPSHALLAVCLQQRKAKPEALREAEQAVALAPDEAFTHFVLGEILYLQDEYARARQACEAAIALDPYDADHFGLLAGIELSAEKPKLALEAAERGLTIDPENARCSNLRAMTLVRLGRKREATDAIDDTLRKNPENAMSHANMGWTCLHRNDPKKALVHFREALRLNPGLSWARDGMLEALRARYFIYRMLLGYYLWTARISPKARWAVVIVAVVGFRALRTSAKNYPDAAPYIWPVMALYIAFVLLTWMGESFFNIFLQFNKFGRAVLEPHERFRSMMVAVLLVSATIFVVLYFLTKDVRLLVLGIACGAMLIPAGSTFSAPTVRSRKVRGWYTIGLAAVATIGVVAYLLDVRPAAYACMIVFGMAFVAYQWVVIARTISGKSDRE